MKNRIIKLIIGVILTFSTTIGLFVYNGTFDSWNLRKYSETYVGQVSESSYGTKDASAKAFLSNELTGAQRSPKYLRHVSIGALTDKEIELLGIEDEVVSAESVAIYFSLNDVEESVNTYIVELADGYHYYSALPRSGAPLTTSYYKSVVDGEKYLNCTSTTTLNLRQISSKGATNSTYMQKIKFRDTIAYMDQQFPGMDVEMYFAESESGNLKVYMEHPQKKDGKFYTLDEINSSSGNMIYEVYLIKGGEKIVVSDLTSMKQVTDFMFMLDLDGSYFVKTDFGFSMPNDKYKAVCKMMAGESYYSEIEQAWEEYKISFNCDYYVEQGRLSYTETVLTMTDGNDVFALNITVRYTDFGTTEIQLPD